MIYKSLSEQCNVVKLRNIHIKYLKLLTISHPLHSTLTPLPFCFTLTLCFGVISRSNCLLIDFQGGNKVTFHFCMHPRKEINSLSTCVFTHTHTHVHTHTNVLTHAQIHTMLQAYWYSSPFLFKVEHTHSIAHIQIELCTNRCVYTKTYTRSTLTLTHTNHQTDI